MEVKLVLTDEDIARIAQAVAQQLRHQQPADEPELVSEKLLAKRLGVSVSWLRKLRACGKIRPTRSGRPTLYSQADAAKVRALLLGERGRP